MQALKRGEKNNMKKEEQLAKNTAIQIGRAHV